jgi:murein L,D-transpeptidase YcbB/YkuD
MKWKKYTILAAAFTMMLGIGFDSWAQITEPLDVKIVINIPRTTLIVFENEKPVIRSKVAVGTGIYPTPEAKMSIGYVVWNPWWIPPPSEWAKDEEKTPPGPGNPLGVVKLPMARGYMLHGTNARSSVGRAASHGCMRMYNEDAGNLAWYLQKNFSSKTDPALREKYAKYRRRSFHVNLNRRIPVEIIYDPIDVIDGELIIFPDYYGKVRGRRTEAIIQTLLNHGITRESIDEERVRHYANKWPYLETRMPLHRILHSPEADKIKTYPAVDNRVRFFH